MFIDASALCAMLTDEDDARELLARLQRADIRITSPLAVWEAVVAIARILDRPLAEARAELEGFLLLLRVEIVAVAPDTTGIAIDAFDRFGKGRHPAALNFGDCFAYAMARRHSVPLLYKGGDFPLTDIEAG